MTDEAPRYSVSREELAAMGDELQGIMHRLHGPLHRSYKAGLPKAPNTAEVGTYAFVIGLLAVAMKDADGYKAIQKLFDDDVMRKMAQFSQGFIAGLQTKEASNE